MKIKVGISNRHVHLTNYAILFKDKPLTKRNDLSQKGEFASCQTVTIEGPKGSIPNVRILGPFRSYTQVEISKTDSYKLGVNPPIRDSGDLKDACSINIINEDNKITRPSCIIPTRHIHLSDKDQEELKLKDVVKIKVSGEKSATLENVHIKVSKNYVKELHLDTDDGNACLLKQNDEVEIINE